MEGWRGWGEVKRADSSSFQRSCHLASVDSMSLAGLGRLGALGLGTSRQKPDAWLLGVS